MAKSAARFVVAFFALASWATWLAAIVHDESMLDMQRGDEGCGVWKCTQGGRDAVTDTGCDDRDKMAKVVQAFSIITMVVMTFPTVVYLINCFSDMFLYTECVETATKFTNPSVWVFSLIAWAIYAASFNREYCNHTVKDHAQLNWGFGFMVFTTAVWLFITYVGMLCHQHIFHHENTPPTPEPTPKTCANSGCNRAPQSGTDHCAEHDPSKCTHSGCSKGKSGNSQFCSEHDPNCQHSGCSQRKEGGSQFCSEHHPEKCKHHTCRNKGVGGMYCRDHTCVTQGCNQAKEEPGSHCRAHVPAKCKEYGCNRAPYGSSAPYGGSGSEYCTEHMGKPLIGFKLKDEIDSSGVNDPGLEVTHVVPRGAADEAGIQEGDQIMSLMNTTSESHHERNQTVAVDEQSQFREFMGRETTRPGDKVAVTLHRSGREMTLHLTLHEKPH